MFDVPFTARVLSVGYVATSGPAAFTEITLK
jgi:hypothetical protein